MNKRTIIFRADGNSTIGMGHFIRTLALAEMLNKHFHCIYATQTPTNYQIKEIENVCHELISLPNDKSHFNVFLKQIKGDEIVVLDNYYFSTDYQKAIKAKGCKLVCIDDMHDKHYVADIVINQIFSDPNLFSVESHTFLLIGFKFILLRKEFGLEHKIQKNKNSILINFGASDTNNITQNVINFILKNKINKEYSIHVLAGNPNKNANKLNSICQKHNIHFYQSLSGFAISNLLEQIEYAILPTSTIAVEALVKKVKVIAGYYTKNQIDTYHTLKTNNLIYPLGNLNKQESLLDILFGLKAEFESLNYQYQKTKKEICYYFDKL